jgi:N-acetylmuramidase
MNFVGKGQPLTRAGLNKVLAALGLGPTDAAYIWTVAEVETAGLTQGRPQILFERHIFRKYTNDSDAPEISGAPGPTDYSRNNMTNGRRHSHSAPRRSSASSQGSSPPPAGAWGRSWDLIRTSPDINQRRI